VISEVFLLSSQAVPVEGVLGALQAYADFHNLVDVRSEYLAGVDLVPETKW
jgi:hypothetical protein